MSTKLELRFKAIEAERKQIFENLKVVPDGLLMQAPGANRWSAVQALQHLVVAERGTNLYLEKKILGKDQVKKSGIGNALRLLIGRLAFIVPLKLKAPKVVANPPANFTLADTEQQWEKVRNDFYSLIKDLKEEDLKKELFKHPVMGRLDIYQTIDFIQIHMNRHAEQAYRTLEELRKNT